MGRFDMENGYKDIQVELVCRKRDRETRDGGSDFEACYSNKKRRIDTPNKEGTFKAMDFASSRKRKQESIFTSTGCANMFKEDIIHRRAKELGNTKLNKKLYQLKKLGVGSKLLERMRWEGGGGLGKYGQGTILSIEVNTRPNNLLTSNVIASQQQSEENEEEDEALSRPLKKKKTEHVTNDDFRLLEPNKTIMIVKENQDDPKRKQLDGLEVITSALNQLNNESRSGTLSLESLGNSFMYMKNRFPDEYKLYGLSTIACSFALPFFSSLFKGWDPLIKPTDHTDIMSVWKDLLQGDEIDSPYAQLFMKVVLSLQRILGQIVVPKLLAAVNSWDPHMDSIPMHIWVHPWLPLLGQKHSILYDTVRTKLESVLNAWHPSDVSAYTILSPWKPVFDREIWEQIMVRCISPKLLAVMHEFQVNPADQKLDQYYWVRKWANVIPIHHMLHIMIVFLNKWLEVLYHWLCSQPNIQEVSNWYLRWQYLIPFEILSNEHIRGLLNMGLDMMNQAVGHK
ncbi:septin and tuftelin-interacting protein 1 homolog 1 [Tanacetum coccineum]